MTTLPIEPAPAAPADARPTPVRRRRLTLSGVNIGDRLYQVVLTGLSLTPPLLLLTLLAELAVSAWPAIKRFGLSFLWTSEPLDRGPRDRKSTRLNSSHI